VLGKAELHKVEWVKAEGKTCFPAGLQEKQSSACWGAGGEACSFCQLSCPNFGLTSYRGCSLMLCAVDSGGEKKEGATG